MLNSEKQITVKTTNNYVEHGDMHMFAIATAGFLAVAAMAFYAISWAIGGSY